MRNTRKVITAVIAAALVAIGVAAPALAEGHRQSYMSNWIDGDASSNWNDKNLDAYNGHVTFKSCTREFQATIRQTITARPDPSVGSEWINCKSYADAVYDGDVKSGNYHFDVTGMGIYNCVGGSCVYNKTSVPELHIYW